MRGRRSLAGGMVLKQATVASFFKRAGDSALAPPVMDQSTSMPSVTLAPVPPPPPVPATTSVVTASAPSMEPSAPPQVQPPSSDELSAYEIERQANIERNNEVLRRLGLAGPALTAPSAHRSMSSQPKKKRAPPVLPTPSTRALRPRTGAVCVEASERDGSVDRQPPTRRHTHDGDGSGGDGDESEDDDGGYVDSSVLRYMCTADSEEELRATSAAPQAAPPSTSCSAGAGVAPLADGDRAVAYGWSFAVSLVDAAAKSIYAMDVTDAGDARRLLGASRRPQHAPVRSVATCA